MHAELNAEAAFRLTGLHGPDEPNLPAGRLRPALAARYRDLARLRYDFPLVLVHDAPEEGFVRSLADVMDEVAKSAGDDAILGKRLLRLEHEIRTLAANGTRGTLAQLWDVASTRLALASGSEAHDALAKARAALKLDGDVVDCDARLPERFFLHAWKRVRAAKARRFRSEVQRRIAGLADVLAADDLRSASGHDADRLRHAMGSNDRAAFDFEVMGRLLDRGLAAPALPPARRERIVGFIAALENARVFDEEPGVRVFRSASEALHAFRVAAPRLSELSATLAMADLEIAGRYDPAQHGVLFEQLRRTPLGRQDLAQYPDSLVCVNCGDLGARGADDLYELLCAGAPVKVVLQSDDLIEEASVATHAPSIGARARAIVGMAIGTGEAYVVQSAASNLLKVCGPVLAALHHPGPALISVYTGAASACDALPPYLLAAAAMESRTFPAFAFDPAAHGDEPSPFTLLGNAQPEADWPVHRLEYEDHEHQRVSEAMAFTAADFLACDARCAGALAAPRKSAASRHVPFAEWLDSEGDDVHASPCIRMVDDNDELHELLVGEPLLSQARRVRDAWRLLRRLAESGRRIVEVEVPVAAPASAPEAPKPAEAAKPAEAPKPSAEPAPAAAPASDDPYIETPRCTTCEECMHVNNRLFAYDANKQAYIADLSAGTYKDLVEAAESCQVSIIHPGKPRNPNEAGLAELLERAAPFL